MAESLKNQTVKNIGYNSVAKIVAFAFAGLANIILSQNLGANDYGIVGFASIFAGFLGRFNDLGIQTAVVQRKELDEKTLYTAFTVKAVLGFFMYLITFVAAGFAPFFFDDPAVVTVIRLVSLGFIINTFAFLPKVLLNRELNFKKISLSEISMSITSSLVAVAMALAGFKYWSIVMATLVSNLVAVLVIVWFKPVRIRVAYDKGIALDLVRFGSNLFLTGMVVFLVFNADNFVVGSVAGSAALGYYALAFNWGSLICIVLGDIVHSVLFPTFSRMQGDADRLKNAYLRVLECVGFAAVLVNLVLFIGAEAFLYYVLGKGTDKWLPSLTTFRIICCYGMLRALLEPVGSVLVAIGRTKLMLKATLLAAVVEVVFLYPAVKLFGIEGAAVLITLAYMSQYGVYWPAMKKSISIREKSVLAAIFPIVFPVVIIGGTFLTVDGYLTSKQSLMAIPAGAALFIIMSGMMSRWKFIYQLKTLFAPKN